MTEFNLENQPRGMRLLTGDELAARDNVTRECAGVAELYQYERISIPTVWSFDTFRNKSGDEIEDQMFVFEDKGGREMCLIPEATAIMRELYKEKLLKGYAQPIRLYYVTRCYRYERPQEGRHREFLQFGCEFLGEDVDLEYGLGECIEMSEYIMGELGIRNYEIHKDIARGLDYYEEAGFEVECPDLGAQSQVIGGGIYDVGVGFAAGIDRLRLAQQREED